MYSIIARAMTDRSGTTGIEYSVIAATAALMVIGMATITSQSLMIVANAIGAGFNN